MKTNLHLKKNSILYRLLTIRLYSTKNLARVEKSKFMYGTYANNEGFYLRPLGILHYLIGLVVQLEDSVEPIEKERTYRKDYKRFSFYYSKRSSREIQFTFCDFNYFRLVLGRRWFVITVSPKERVRS